MSYKIYTFPNCDKCQNVKKILEEKNIEYQEVNAGLGNGRVDFLEFYKQKKDFIERDNNGQIVLPIVVSSSGIYQGLEKITELAQNGN